MRVGTALRILAVVAVGLVVAAVAVLSTLDVNQYKADVADAVKQATGRDLTIEGDLDLKISLSPVITVAGLRFANAPWGARPEMAVLGRASVEVELFPLLTGDIAVNRLVLEDLNLMLETDAKGMGNWRFGENPEPVEQSGKLTLPRVGKVVVKNITVTWRDGKTGETAHFAVAHLNAETAQPGAPLKFDLLAAFDGQPVEASGEVGTLEALASGVDPYPVALSISAVGANAEVDGTVARPLEAAGLSLNFSVSGDNLAEAGEVVGVALPRGAYRAAAKVSGSMERLAVSGLQLSLGETNLAGDVQVGLAGRRPRIEAALTSALIDLDQILPLGADRPAHKAPAEQSGKRVFSAEPLALDGLHAVDAVVRLNAGRVKSGKFALSNLSIMADLKNGMLTVNPFRAELAGGQVSGDVFLADRKGTADLKSRLKVIGLDLGRLSKETGGGDMLAAKGDIDVDLSSRGRSVRALMAGLNGSVGLTTGRGKVNSTALDILFADVLGAITPFLEKRDQTVLNCLVGRFDIKDGLAADRGLIFDTETMTVAGEGEIDLKTEKLDLIFTPRPKEPSLLDAAIPILVKGTLAKPSVTPDPAGLAKKAAGVALTVVNPLVALVPIVTEAMSGDDNPCLSAINRAKAGTQKAGQPTPAKKQEGGIGSMFNKLKSLGTGGD